MKRRKVIPKPFQTFLYRQGLKIMPSQNFIDKFKEEYLLLISKRKNLQHVTIDDDKAVFFIISFFEAIVYCLDCNIDIFLYHILAIKSKVTDYMVNTRFRKKSVYEDVKKITFKLYSYYRLKMFKNVNKDNENYTEYLKEKRKRYGKIRDYYKKFYNKEGEWWTHDKPIEE